MSRSGGPILIAWMAADVGSLAASRLAMIAIPWLVLTTTGSASTTGLVAMVEMAAYVVAKLLAGPLVDRFGARRVSVISDLAAAVVLAGVPVLAHLNLLPLPLVVVLVTVVGLLRGPGDGAKHALTPRIADATGAPLERITGLAGTIERLASSVGALAAGGLVALVGPPNALAANAVLLLASAILVALGLRRLPAEDPVPSQGYLADFRTGWRGWRGDRLLVVMTLMIMVTNMMDQAYSVVMLPVWVHDHRYGAEVLGLLVGVTAGASMVGAILATVFAARLPRLTLFVVGFLAAGLPRFAVLALDAPMTAVVVVFAGAGLASGFVNPIIGAVMFERIPRAMTGRVTALVSGLCWSLMPLGGLAGLLVTGVGLSPTLWLAGVAYLAVTMLPLVVPAFRGMSRRPRPSVVPAA